MNNTYNKRANLNPASFEIYQYYKQDAKSKKSSMMISNSKNIFKQAFLPGMNSPGQMKTMYGNYSNFPFLSKCHSTMKISKAPNNNRLSSQSYYQFQHNNNINNNSNTNINKVSPSPSQSFNNMNRVLNDKTVSTLQSTDDRVEIMKLKAEVKEKNEVIITLNKTIENYSKENKLINEELETVNGLLINSHQVNEKLRKEIKTLQLAYNKLKNSYYSNCNNNSNKNNNNSYAQGKEFKLTEIMELFNKEESHYNINANPNVNKEKTIAIESEEGVQFEEDQSLSAICFTDKVKMEKTISISDNALPTLNFDFIGNNNPKDKMMIKYNNERNKPQFNSIENINKEATIKHIAKNNSAIQSSYKKISFGKSNTLGNQKEG